MRWTGRAIGSLSGGQRQALTLLMATWLRPELLLLDEHTAALDPKSADLVIALTEQVVVRQPSPRCECLMLRGFTSAAGGPPSRAGVFVEIGDDPGPVA